MADSNDVGDSDSSDDNTTRLREALDSDFINDSMFNGKPTKGKKELEAETVTASTASLKPTSLRERDDCSQQYNGLHVTPEFQKHVAKHLEKILDSQLKEKRKKTLLQPPQEPVGGVRLFSDSPVYLSLKEEISQQNNGHKQVKRKRTSRTSSEDDEYNSRFRESAVTPDWVLEQTGTKGWVPSTKGTKVIVNTKGVVISEDKL